MEVIDAQEEGRIDNLYFIKKHVKAVRNPDGSIDRIPTKVRIKRQIKMQRTGFRLVHWVVDAIAINIIHSILGLAIIFIPGAFVIVLAWPLVFIGYYFFFELTGGTTLGKLITGSVVVDNRGEKPDSSKALLRSFIRLVPFDGISFVFAKTGWHDAWSKTYVISKKELEKLKSLRSRQEEVMATPVDSSRKF